MKHNDQGESNTLSCCPSKEKGEVTGSIKKKRKKKKKVKVKEARTGRKKIKKVKEKGKEKEKKKGAKKKKKKGEEKKVKDKKLGRKRKKGTSANEEGKTKKTKRKRPRSTDGCDKACLPASLRIDVENNSTDNGNGESENIDAQLESEEVLRSSRDEIHVKETKEAAAIILDECKDTLERVKIIDVSQSPRLTAARCENFINNLVHSNRMIHHKVDQSQKVCEFAAEPVKRQWEESFLHELMGDQHACVKFKLGQCIATEMYSNVHGTDFTLREYFTPREMANLHSDESNNNPSGAAKLKRTTKKTPESDGATCLLCRRHDVLSAILVARSKGDQVANSLVLPNTANFVNVKGEYDLSNVVYNLPCRYEGLLDPVATVNQRYFEPFMHNGVRWLRQTIPYSKGEACGTLASTHF